MAALAIVTATKAAITIRIDCERVIMFVWKPMIRNAIVLPKNAAIAQKVVTASLVAGSIADRMV